MAQRKSTLSRPARAALRTAGTAFLVLTLSGCVQTSSDAGGFQNEPGPIGTRTPQTFGSGK